MAQINNDYYEDLDPQNFVKLLDDLVAGRPVVKGSQTGRVGSAPVGGLTSLTSLYGVDGRGASAGEPAVNAKGVETGAGDAARIRTASSPISTASAISA